MRTSWLTEKLSGTVHLFRCELGIAPGRYVETVRLARAQHLLGVTTWSVKEIAVRVGFEEVGYFSRRFRHWTGSSPRAYRTVNFAASEPQNASRQPS